MRVNFTGRHVDVTDALKEYTVNKLGRLDRLVDSGVEAHVTFTVQKYRHSAELTLRSSGTSFFVAKETDDMYTAVDKAIDTIERQLTRHKSRITDHKSRPVRTERANGAALPAEEEIE